MLLAAGGVGGGGGGGGGVGWCLGAGKYDEDWKFGTNELNSSILGNYRGTSLSCNMLCEPYISENEDKYEDDSSGNCIVSLKIDNRHK